MRPTRSLFKRPREASASSWPARHGGREEFETLDEARHKIGSHIDAYHHRPHSRPAYRTPREVAPTWKDHDDQLPPAA